MKQALATVVEDICRRYECDRTRMTDIVIAVQQRLGCVSTEAMEIIARMVNSHRVEVESVVTFYSFLSVKPRGKIIIRLCNDIVDWMKGYEGVADAMAKELGITLGETTADGAITLTYTPCIGMPHSIYGLSNRFSIPPVFHTASRLRRYCIWLASSLEPARAGGFWESGRRISIHSPKA